MKGLRVLPRGFLKKSDSNAQYKNKETKQNETITNISESIRADGNARFLKIILTFISTFNKIGFPMNQNLIINLPESFSSVRAEHLSEVIGGSGFFIGGLRLCQEN